MADTLLDIYGNYDRALQRYNQAGQAWQNAANAYNNSVIWDENAYSRGSYTGGNPYTLQDGYKLGRTGAPIKTYQTDPLGYNTVYDYNNPINVLGYDESGNPQYEYASTQVPYYGGTNETTYVDPTTGLASLYYARPAESFDMTAPIAPPPQQYSDMTSNINPEELYQKQFGRSTPDVLSNEAWSLANLTSPFLSSEAGTIYETGGLAQINNPLSYVGPDALTTGQISQPQAGMIGTENKYY